MNATELLQEALEEEDAERAAEAIREGADVNALWDDQRILSGAAQIGNIELIKLLLASGADPNRKNDDGGTALTWGGTAEITALLLDAGASARYELGQETPFFSLHNAATLQIGLNSSALDVARQRTDKPELLECIEESLRQRGVDPKHA